MEVIALDLEGTLISNAMSQIARPGLHHFLEACKKLCNRIVIFTTVREALFYQIATMLVNEGFAPYWFKEIEYVYWKGETKNFGFIKNVDPDQVVLVDDFEGYVCSDQKSNWIEIKTFCHPYSDSDNELQSVSQQLKLYALAQHNHNSVAEIVHYNLTTKEKMSIENHQHTYKVLLQSVEAGVFGGILLKVATHIPKRLLAEAIGTSVNNLGRLSKKNLNIHQSDALIDLSRLWFELRQFFNFNESSIGEWIDTPLPALDGIAPGHLMSTIAGRNELRKLLNTMRSGDF